MTAEEIIDLLPIVADRDFRVTEEGYIMDRHGRCPMCSLANELNPDIRYTSAAISALKQLLGLRTLSRRNYAQVSRVMTAADIAGGGLEQDLRARMKAALGLAT